MRVPHTPQDDRNDHEEGARDLVVKQRTRLFNEIHALHKRRGIKLKKDSLSSQRHLMALDSGRFSTLERIEFKVLRDQVLSRSESFAELDRESERVDGATDGYGRPFSIKDISPRAAAVLLAGIGNVNDFESADKLAGHLGIVPKVDRSNEIENPERITYGGNRLVRATLLQCAVIAIRHSGQLHAYYRRIGDRRGAGKAIIATLRKLLPVIYEALRNLWIFEDRATFVRHRGSVPAGQPSQEKLHIEPIPKSCRMFNIGRLLPPKGSRSRGSGASQRERPPPDRLVSASAPQCWRDRTACSS